jgi:hypothetical protein
MSRKSADTLKGFIAQSVIDGLIKEVEKMMGIDARNKPRLQVDVLESAYRLAFDAEMPGGEPLRRDVLLRLGTMLNTLRKALALRSAPVPENNTEGRREEENPSVLPFPTPATDEENTVLPFPNGGENPETETTD